MSSGGGSPPLKQLRLVPIWCFAFWTNTGLFVLTARQPFVAATTPTPQEGNHPELGLLLFHLTSPVSTAGIYQKYIPLLLTVNYR